MVLQALVSDMSKACGGYELWGVQDSVNVLWWRTASKARNCGEIWSGNYQTGWGTVNLLG